MVENSFSSTMWISRRNKTYLHTCCLMAGGMMLLHLYFKRGMSHFTDTDIYILIRYWVILSVCLCVCPCAIETTFPLPNFKTKHIFGILIALGKYYTAPQFFFLQLLSRNAAEDGCFANRYIYI